MDLATEQKKLLKETITAMRKEVTLTARQLYYKEGLDIALKKTFGSDAKKIIKENNKFTLPKELMKRISKYTKTQQKQILKVCEAKVTSGEIKKTDLWHNGLLSKFIDQVVEKQQ